MTEPNTTTESYRVEIGFVLFLLGIFVGWSLTSKVVETSQTTIPITRSSIITNVRSRPDSTEVHVAVPIRAISVAAIANVDSEPMLDSTLAMHDSVVTISCIDTILRSTDSNAYSDTLSVCHYLPQDSFAIAIRFSARQKEMLVHYDAHDSIVSRSDTIMLQPNPEKKWYEEALEVFGALFAGFLLGSFKL